MANGQAVDERDGSTRATHEQRLELLSECGFLIGKLEEHGDTARVRVASGTAARWDGYPSSSLPENSSVSGGQTGDPTGTTVARKAGAKDEWCDSCRKTHCPDCHGTQLDAENKACRSCVDNWGERHDPVGSSVERMRSDARRAANRLADALKSSYQARGIAEWADAVRVSDTEPWGTTLIVLGIHIAELIASADDVRAAGSNHARSRMEGQAIDARDRLRSSVKAMNGALPVKLPDVERERCASCGRARDIITDFGAHPNYWIKFLKCCRACAKRIGENTKAS